MLHFSKVTLVINSAVLFGDLQTQSRFVLDGFATEQRLLARIEIDLLHLDFNDGYYVI